ncbi:MAG: alpha/beta fold hydrolase, partial [Halobacteriota archaeon]
AGFLGFIALIRDGQQVVDALLSLMFPQIACTPFVDMDGDGIEETNVYGWLQDMFDSYGSTARLGACWEIQKDHPELINNLSNIKTPTRIIHGCCDPFVPFRLSQYTQDYLIPGADLVQFDGKLTKIPFGGHGAFFEQPKDFNPLLNWQPP